MDHLGTNLDQFLWVPSIAEISPRFFEIINPTRFAIYFDTLGVPDMQFSELICISYPYVSFGNQSRSVSMGP